MGGPLDGGALQLGWSPAVCCTWSYPSPEPGHASVWEYAAIANDAALVDCWRAMGPPRYLYALDPGRRGPVRECSRMPHDIFLSALRAEAASAALLDGGVAVEPGVFEAVFTPVAPEDRDFLVERVLRRCGQAV